MGLMGRKWIMFKLLKRLGHKRRRNRRRIIGRSIVRGGGLFVVAIMAILLCSTPITAPLILIAFPVAFFVIFLAILCIATGIGIPIGAGLY